MADVFAHDRYRSFLTQAFEDLKAQRKTFSMRWFAQKAGFGSHTYLPRVLRGERGLSQEAAGRVAKALGLKARAEKYFKLLVAWEEAESPEEAEEVWKEIQATRAFRDGGATNARHLRYYDKWYLPIVRQLAVWSPWNEDYSRLAGMLEPPISTAEAKEAVEILVEMGLLTKRDDGKWETSSPTLDLSRLPLIAKRKGRHDILRRAMESVSRLPAEERYTSCVLMAMSEKSYRKVEDLFAETVRQALGIAAADPSVERIWQGVLQIYPQSRRFGTDP